MDKLILLNIDGNRRTRVARSGVLARAGFPVIEAADGRAALKSVREHRDRPVLALLRESPPDLNPAEVCRDLKEGAAAPIFLLWLSDPKAAANGKETAAACCADACLHDNYRQPEWLSAIEAFAGFIERQAADRRCIGALQAELAERERAIETLHRERDERPRSAAEAAEVGTWWIDLDAGLESRDANVNRILGLPAEPSIAPLASAATRLPPEDRPRIEAAFRHLTTEGGIYDEEFRVVLPDGSVRWVRDRGWIIADTGGRPVYAMGTLAEITEHKRAEESLRFERILLEALQTAAPVGLGFVGRDCRYIRVNQTLAEMNGIPADRHIGRSVEDIVPNLWPTLEPFYRRVLDSGEIAANLELSGETRAQPGITRHWLVNYYPLRVDGEIVAAGIVVQEITERKRAEKALRESERRLDLALMGAELGSWDWNVRTGEMRVDDRWAKMFDPTASGTVAHYDDWLRLLHPDDRERVLDALNAHLEGECPFYEAEYRIFVPDTGRWTWVQARGKALERDPDGKPVQAAGIYRDISDRKALEERLRQQQEKLLHAQRLTTAGELAAMVAHEINQPLGAITNYLGGASLRFRDVLAANPALDEVINEALRLSRRAAEVVKGIRDLVRRHDQQREHLLIPALLNDCLLLARAELCRRGVRLVLDVPPDLPPIWGQRVHLQQLVLNLILNAMEAMESSEPDRRELRLRAGPAGEGGVELSFSDSGVGFSGEFATHLAEPFVSTKPEGIGLGLSICRTIVEAHGGRMSACSTPGRGATFRVWLPIANDE